ERAFNIDETLSNPLADKSAIALYDWIKAQFGKKIISGQTYTQTEWTYIKTLTGKTPVIRTWDMQQYSPRYPYLWDSSCSCHTFGPNSDATLVEDAIEWYNAN